MLDEPAPPLPSFAPCQKYINGGALRQLPPENLVAQGKAQDGIKPSDVKYIVPQSAEMIALITRINKND